MKEAIIFDYNRTLVQGDESPPSFFPETLALLTTLKNKGVKMAVVSVGENPEQRQQEFELLGLADFISVFKIVGKNDPKDLRSVLDELQVDAQNCVVVGDRIRKEITEGNKVGATTVWLKKGKFAQEVPESPEEEPDFIIESLSQLMLILS